MEIGFPISRTLNVKMIYRKTYIILKIFMILLKIHKLNNKKYNKKIKNV